MGATTKKLAEAAFFLQQMESLNPSEATFDYYLNAFISSARSVTWVMQSEYNDVPGWRSWYDAKAPTADEEPLLECFRDLRNRSVKTGPLETKTRLELELSIDGMTDQIAEKLDREMRKMVGKRMKVTVSDGGQESIAFGENQLIISGKLIAAMNLGRFLDRFPEKDALAICKRYYALLQKLVMECTLAFGDFD